MNLTEIAAIPKKLFIPISVIFIVGILIFLIVYRFTSSKKTIPVPETKIQAITFIKSPILQGPTSLKINDKLNRSTQEIEKAQAYNLQEKSLSQTQAQALAANFGFVEEPKITNDKNLGQSFQWSNTSGMLKIDNSKLTYIKSISEKSQNIRNINSSEDLKPVIDQLLEKYNLQNTSFTLSKNEIRFYKYENGVPQKTEDLIDSDLISTTISYNLEGIPLVDHNASADSITITVDRSGQATLLSYRFPPSIEPISNYPLTPINDAVKEIRTGNYTVADLKPEFGSKGEGGETVKIQSAILENVSLAYYFSQPVPLNLQPVYLFTGKGQTNFGTGTIRVLVPAIARQFLSSP